MKFLSITNYKLFFLNLDHYALNHFFSTFSILFSKNQKSTQKPCVFFLKSQMTFENLYKSKIPTTINYSTLFLVYIYYYIM